ncbi:MAG: LysM peptidoglycan-binding domain-containing protein [Thermodesulfobacteriota bacterium]|nr:LysM peptidoglycan-binding domain-containing protein [Thermodesulfobacteriota bacterium]
MKRYLSKAFSIIFIMAPFFLGCAHFIDVQDRSDRILVEKLQKKSKEYEKLDDLQLALLHWQIIEALTPEDIQAEKKMLSLEAEIDKQANRHFNKGLAYYRKNFLELAQKEFLITLRYQPDHEDALSYLKERLNTDYYLKYTVKKGDSLSKIAKKFYGNPYIFFPIAYFNDLNPKAVLMPGAKLKIIKLEPMITEQLIDIKKELSVARILLKRKNFRVSLSVLKDILDYDPTNSKAASLKDTVYYTWGEMLYSQKDYLSSLKMFKMVDPDYNGVKESISKVSLRLKKQADEHYRKGVKHFIKEELVESIEEWKKALTIYPDHKDAKKYIKDTKRLLKKLDNIKDAN